MAVTATARNVRVSPQKVRPVLDLIRGRPVEEALQRLRFLPSPAAQQVRKVLRSATANAENTYMMSTTDLDVVAAYADKGMVLKRFRSRSRARVGRDFRRFSHVTVLVDEREA